MMKFKKIFAALSLIALSGCAQMTQVQNRTYDYDTFCPTDTSKTEDKEVVIKTDQRYFYITSDGSVYSQRELQQLNNHSDALSSSINAIVGNVIPKQSKSDPSTAKRVIVRKFVYQSDRNKSYCATNFVEDDTLEIKDGSKFVLDLSKLDIDNRSVYNNTSKKVLLTPIR